MFIRSILLFVSFIIIYKLIKNFFIYYKKNYKQKKNMLELTLCKKCHTYLEKEELKSHTCLI